MAVVRFPKLNDLQEALADLVAEAIHEMNVVAASHHINEQYERGAIGDCMSRHVWLHYCLRKMERLKPNRSYIFQKPAKMNAELLDITNLRRIDGD